MKKNMEDMIKEFQNITEELQYMREKYPLYYKDHGIYKRTPLPEEILHRYDILEKRKKNLQININQIKMKGI